MRSCIIVDLPGMSPKFNLVNIVKKNMSNHTYQTDQKTYY